jgi:polyhydroxybutyrate depolymerase
MNTASVKKILLLVLILLSACKPDPPEKAATCQPGTYDEEIVIAGQTRQYRLHIPASYEPGTAMPLLIGFHGAGSDAATFESYSGFSALADKLGFIAVYPQGLGQITNWDTMPNSTDVPFVRDLIDALGSRCSIDLSRIYASGHSRGGGMANRLACELSDRIAAIGPVSGDYENSEDCSPSRPVPVAAFHGTADPTIPYNGFGLPGQIHESYLRISMPIPGWAAAWAERNGCGNKPEKVFESGPVTGQGWSGCNETADVVLYTVAGGDHGWPSAVDAASLLWKFFEAHALIEK